MTGIPEDAQFMMQIMSAMHTSTTATVDSMWRMAVVSERRNEANLYLVRRRVTELLRGPYMPHPDAILVSLYASDRDVEEMAIELYGEDWTNPTSMRRPHCCDY